MKKILVVITTAMSYYGGLSSVMLNYYREMDKNNIKIDFASTNQISKELTDELKENGSKYYNLGNRKKHIVKYIIKLKNILKKEKYDVIHVNGNSSTMILELNIAKKCGVKNRIAHTHSATSNYPIINKLLSKSFSKLYTKAISVSSITGKWIYKDNFTVLNNAINTEEYKYDIARRDTMRCRLNLKDTDIVIGNVGKLNEHKNHQYLINIFYELYRINNNFKLMIVGGGELEEKLKKQAEQLGIINNIIFTGMVDDTSDYIQAMDIFVFTSKFEGLGLAVIEAQASGLYCYVSDNVPKETKVTNNIEYISLDKLPNEWADIILNKKLANREELSKQACIDIEKNGYSIKTEANKLRNIYLS